MTEDFLKTLFILRGRQGWTQHWEEAALWEEDSICIFVSVKSVRTLLWYVNQYHKAGVLLNSSNRHFEGF